ncbi:hypothetical protein AAG570_007654 [Ranatra chinensis]|uniref:N-acetyltransferase domain-containing protein n=1 Tax=Ranatra chinensis TaxID=642074 RepID=A0ABD0YI13_9HEMI
MPKCNRKSLLVKRKNLPWKKTNATSSTRDQTQEIDELTEYEEDEFLKKLRLCNYELIPENIRRLKRKFVLKKLKQIHMRNEVDFENESIVGIIPTIPHKIVNCTYTDRKLKPIIRKGLSKMPLYISMFVELNEKLKKMWPSREHVDYKPCSIEFLYVQPHHIPAINALVNCYFWPLIDMNCVLEYKEFSCVAVYKKLIIGFGFLFPGEHLNEGYISFLFVRPHWRNCGIGNFMLYHLIQTSFSWDHTLHVSATNPSLFLYQKFGFKFEKMYIGFYDKYLQSDSKESRHALYCKLD